MDDGASTATYYVEGELSLQWDCDLGELSGLDLIGLIPDTSEENYTYKCPYLALRSSSVDRMDEKEVMPLLHNGNRSLLLSQNEVNEKKNVPLLHVLDKSKKKDLDRMGDPDPKKKDAHQLDDNEKTRPDLHVQDKKLVVVKLEDVDEKKPVVELVVPDKKTVPKLDKSYKNAAVPKFDVLDMKMAVPELDDLDEKNVIPVSNEKLESKVAHVRASPVYCTSLPSSSYSAEKNADSIMSMLSSSFFGARSTESSSQLSYTDDKSCVVPVGPISSNGPKVSLQSVDAKSALIPPFTTQSSLAGSSPLSDTKSTITSTSRCRLSQISGTPKRPSRTSSKRKRETSSLSNASKNGSSMKTSPFSEYCKDSSSKSQKKIPSSQDLRLASQRDPTLYLEAMSSGDGKSLQLHEANESAQSLKRSRHKRGRRHQCPFAIGDSCRPRNSFIFFSMKERPRLTAANPHFGFGEISKLLAQTWHSMSDAEKEVLAAKIETIERDMSVHSGNRGFASKVATFMKSFKKEKSSSVINEKQALQRQKTVLQRRSAVCAEVTSQLETFTPKVVSKSEDAKQRLQISLKKNYLFKTLDKEQTKTVIDAVEEVKYKPGEVIIKQGDPGDCFYLLEEGICEIWRLQPGNVEPEMVKQCSPGDAFGELALLYNAPRAATVKASTHCTLWAMDRVTFQTILLHTTSGKRKLHEKFLEDVPLLKTLDKYERSAIADVVETEYFESGQKILTEGQTGDKLYLLEEGEAEATKGGKVLMKYKHGDYFGELALLNNKPRAATVTAITLCKCVSIDRESFKRLFGKLEVIMQRNKNDYKRDK